jgi:putative ATP-dependent endonuclease of the OLD family
MFLAELRIENFRIFGEGKDALTLSLRPGLTALVGENDTGKTAVMDAIRFALGTRDQEYIRVEESDFHRPPGEATPKTEIKIRCRFSDLSPSDISAFSEYLTYVDESGAMVPVLYINWRAVGGFRAHRRITSVEVKSGLDADGPALDQDTRWLLCSTYLRPLRDAERALSAGRSSRLSQILQYTKEINEHGEDYDHENGPPDDPSTLSVLGIADFANALLGDHKGIQSARERLNIEFLRELSFSGSVLEGHISVSGAKGDDKLRLRLLLEKLELDLRDGQAKEFTSNRGLGSNNLLFMACELLLLGSEQESFPLLLVEEPEAHLHPQRQLRLMQFLQQKAKLPRQDGQHIQIIVSTHSPNLASAIQLDNLVFLSSGKAYPLSSDSTELDASDYGFLARFLDVTKANLFFARGVMIVEGDAENLLLPTLARLLERDFTSSGVSVVNVGGIGLRRFARIFQRKDPAKHGAIPVPVACVTDMDVMPDCAPEITERVNVGAVWPEKGKRRWRAKKDFTADELTKRRAGIRAKASGQRVETFVSDEWTLEYDLAYAGLAREVWIAAHLAIEDDAITAGRAKRYVVTRNASRTFEALEARNPPQDELASRVYAPFLTHSKLSKATAAQYLAWRLEVQHRRKVITPQSLRAILPRYIVDAIDYVTSAREQATPGDSVTQVAGTSTGATAA